VTVESLDRLHFDLICWFRNVLADVKDRPDVFEWENIRVTAHALKEWRIVRHDAPHVVAVVADPEGIAATCALDLDEAAAIVKHSFLSERLGVSLRTLSVLHAADAALEVHHERRHQLVESRSRAFVGDLARDERVDVGRRQDLKKR
jgi:hypothetical protein